MQVLIFRWRRRDFGRNSATSAPWRAADNVNPYETFETALTSSRHLRSLASPVLTPITTDFQRKSCTRSLLEVPYLRKTTLPRIPKQCQPLCWKLKQSGRSPLDGVVYVSAKLARSFSVFLPPSDAQQRRCEQNGLPQAPNTVEMDFGFNERISTFDESMMLEILEDQPSGEKEDEKMEASPVVPASDVSDYPDGGLAAWCVALGVSRLTISSSSQLC